VASPSGNPKHLTKSFSCPSSFQLCLINFSNTFSGPSLRWVPSLKRACAFRARVHLASRAGGVGAPVTWSLLIVLMPLGLSIRNRYPSCSTTPEALYSWLWALVLGSRVVGGVSPLWRATAACEGLRRTCLGELVRLSGADSGA